MFNPNWDVAPTYHHYTSSPLKPLFTVTLGDRRHGNITLELIPAPITWETRKSQTKKRQENGQMGQKGEKKQNTSFSSSDSNLEGSEI